MKDISHKLLVIICGLTVAHCTYSNDNGIKTDTSTAITDDTSKLAPQTATTILANTAIIEKMVDQLLAEKKFGQEMRPYVTMMLICRLLIKEVAHKLNVPEPKFDFKASNKIYAHCTQNDNGTFIIINPTALYNDNLTVDEIRAIIAHEIGHIKNNDIEKKRKLINLRHTAALIATLSLNVPFFFALNGLNNNIKFNAMITSITMIINHYGFKNILNVIWFNKILKQLELNADQVALTAVNDPQSVANLLEKICTCRCNSIIEQLLSDHPCYHERIKKCEAYIAQSLAH